MDRSIDCLRDLFAQLADHGIDPENSRELGAVYLVGGSVQFPAVQRLLRQAYGRKVQLAPQPHAATAIGLAIAADEGAGIYIREASTRHFGVWREARDGLEKVFDPLIAKRGNDAAGTLRIERRYRPEHAVGRLRFVECSRLDDQGQPAGDVTPGATVLFPYDPSLRACEDLSPFSGQQSAIATQQDIVETYVYDTSGRLQVAIENRSAGYSRRFTLGGGC